MNNPFFKNYGPFSIKDLLKDLKLTEPEKFNDDLIHNIKDLNNANKNDLTFFHSKKYSELASSVP